MNYVRLVLVTLAVLLGRPALLAAEPSRDAHRVVFVCEHGSVKSLVASLYFNQRARQRGLPYTAIARGTAPDAAVPATVRDGLRAAGFDVAQYVPQPLKTSDVNRASLVVSFDQDIEKTVAGKAPELKWDNLPGVLADYPRGRDAIVERVDGLIERLAADGGSGVATADVAALELESKIPLGEVRGRIDHLAVDAARQRLYVAELGNDSLGVIDLKERKAVQALTGLKEPQGIGYEPSTDTLWVANAGDGSVRVYQGSDLASIGQISLGDDADNVRIDEALHRVWVGYGSGALAVIDPGSRRKIADIPLQGHPESFRLERGGSQIFVNVPAAGEIAVVDRAANKQVTSWKTDRLRANFPLALDDNGQVLAVFRHPARLAVFRKGDGHLVKALETCGDSDDLFVDSKRHRVYVVCGEGSIDVFAYEAAGYRALGRVATSGGARTALFVPELDRLYLAVRATTTNPASIWVFRPAS